MTEKDWKQEIVNGIRYRSYYPVDKNRFFKAIKEALNLAEEHFEEKIIGIRKIILENVADEGLEALLQIKINELRKEREEG